MTAPMHTPERLEIIRQTWGEPIPIAEILRRLNATPGYPVTSQLAGGWAAQLGIRRNHEILVEQQRARAGEKTRDEMVSVSTWTTPTIDARIIALKQAGLSHAQIAREIVAEFRVFVNKNMVLRRARTILGIDRGEKAANERLERKRKAEKAALEPKAPKTRPMAMPPPTVTLPPLASALVAWPVPPSPPPPPPLGNGKCAFPLWANGAAPSHEYCSKQTPLGSSWCASCRAVVWHTYRQARAA